VIFIWFLGMTLAFVFTASGFFYAVNSGHSLSLQKSCTLVFIYAKWPFNGKSLWSSLPVGQHVAVIIGLPVIYVMHQSFADLIAFTECFRPLNALLKFIGIFVIPFVYFRGFGMVVANVIDAVLILCRK
jgi:hypothetical protein